MINKYFSTAVLAVSALVASAASKAEIIGFEDITEFTHVGTTGAYHQLTIDYGYSWTGGRYNQPDWAVSPESSNWWAPYSTGPLAHSGNNYVWASLDEGMQISGHGINLVSIWMRGANLVSNVSVTVRAFKDGTEIGTKTFGLSETYQLETFNFLNADILSFSSNGSGGLVMDDMSISSTSAVPEPETYAMLLAGLGLVGAITRRKRTAA